MFKHLLKFTVLVISVVGFCTVLSGSKVAADSNCPTPGNGGNPPPSWGINTGSDTHGFASMTVHTTDSDGSDLDNVGFTVHSQLPDPGPGYSYGSTPPGTTVNDRIFQWGNTGPGSAGRWSSYRFQTGETNYVGSNPGQIGPANFQCVGWTELGPGVKVHHPGTPDIPANYVREDGNNFVLDCVEVKTKGASSVDVPVHFWIANVDPPSRDNAYGGHWSAIVHDSNGNQIAKVNDLSANPMGFGNNDFYVNNGLNVRVDLVWNANPKPHHNGGGSTPQCTNLDVTGSGQYQTSNGSWWDTYTHYKVTQGYFSGSNFVETGTLAEGGDSQYGPNPGHWTPSYTATEPWVKVYVERKYKHLNGTNWVETDIPGFPTTNYFNCYSAHCGTQEVDGNVPNGPGNAVIQGTQFKVIMYVTNDGPGTLSNPKLNGQLPDNGYYPLYHDSSGGDTGYYTFYPTAPGGGPQNYTVNFTFNDSGVGNFSASCSVTVPVFQHFNINPNPLNINADKENPVTVSYTTHGQSTEGPTVSSTTTSWLTKQPFGAPAPTQGSCGVECVDSHSTVDAYGTVDHTWTYINPVINAGDQFCAFETINPGSGYVGPPGYGDANDQPISSNSPCVKTVNEPYTHFLGSDVSAGGGFGQSCPTTSRGTIYAYNEQPGKGGAGTQFGAQAMNIISGLSTASLRSGAPSPPSGLAFANTENIGGSQPSATTGGYLGAAAAGNFCVPDYFSDKSPSTTSDTAAAATAGAGNAQQWHKPAGGTLLLSGGTIANGTNQTILVDGNVEITGDITYSGLSRGSVKDIPSFYLIVKNGNIHIDPGVKRLDGVYVAQPDTTNAATIAKTGIINTCWLANNYNQTYNLCKNQLVVNGAFVADRVLLARSYSSLRYSQNGENLNTAAHSCGNPGNDVPLLSSVANDCAAEIFNFSPDFFMTQPNLNPRFGPGTGKFDAITSLSPVL